MNKKDLWIGGIYRKPILGDYYFSNNPVDDKPIAEVARAGVEDVALAISAADKAFNDYKDSPPEVRESILSKSANLLERDSDVFTQILVEEIGSPISKAQYEVKMAISALRAAIGIVRNVSGSTFDSDDPGRLSLSFRSPLGVVASITPFNVPLLISVRSTANALALGNTVVSLPSDLAPLLGLQLGALYEEAGVPAGAFNVVTGFGQDVGDALTADPRVKAVTFTGSSTVGKHIASICGKHLKPVTLELGGKNPLVILDDADLDKAVQGAIFGIFLYQGQVCMGSSRIYVEKGIFDEFAERFTIAAKALSIGDLEDPQTFIGPIINRQQRDRIQHHVSNAIEKGATLLCGGRWQGNVCEPTVFTGVTSSMVLFDEETFGPVTSLYKVEDYDDALDRANDSKYGLSAAIYTQDVSKAMQFAKSMKAGMVHINAPTLHDEPHVPFGGMADSGLGRVGTIESIETMTELKWVTVKI